jgi:hypothetical protein
LFAWGLQSVRIPVKFPSSSRYKIGEQVRFLLRLVNFIFCSQSNEKGAAAFTATPLKYLARHTERNRALLVGNPSFTLIPYQDRTMAPQGNTHHFRKGDPALLLSGEPLDSR